MVDRLVAQREKFQLFFPIWNARHLCARQKPRSDATRDDLRVSRLAFSNVIMLSVYSDSLCHFFQTIHVTEYYFFASLQLLSLFVFVIFEFRGCITGFTGTGTVI